MPRTPKLSDDAVAAALRERPPWSIEAGKLHREYRFADFSEAFAFMTRVAMAAEQLDHHPEWSNVYNRVVVDLTTHDSGGISQSDLDLADRMDLFAADPSSG